MMEFRVCPDCGGYEMVPIPQKIGSYDGTADASQRPWRCKLEDEEREKVEEGMPVSNGSYETCPQQVKKATAMLEDGRIFVTDNIFAERVVWREII